MPKLSARIQDHFVELTDPRRRKVTYPLINIVSIAICAVRRSAATGRSKTVCIGNST